MKKKRMWQWVEWGGQSWWLEKADQRMKERVQEDASHAQVPNVTLNPKGTGSKSL